MFEKASRLKLRFNYKGICSVEDLWDIPLKDLDSIYKKFNAQLKAENEESLLNKKTAENELIELQMNIVKYIVETKLNEQQKRKELLEKAAQKQKIMSIISKKQDEHLENMPIEELMKLIDE